jgi:DMSO/TMAO reductase YedYZ molybdopterin-dependent catalytic subunit
LKSFLLGGAGLFLVGLLCNWIMHQPKSLGTPWPLRKVLEWNGAIGQKLFNPEKIPPLPTPPSPGKTPRFNGDIGLSNEIRLDQWRLNIISPSNLGKSKKLALSIENIKWLPKVETLTEFKCIEGWSDVISYAGVRFLDFLKYYRLGTKSGESPDPRNRPEDLFSFVGLETPDRGYYVSLDMESMLHPQTLLVYEMNGKPLDLQNGAPLRLIIPVKYGIKSLKRIGTLFFSETRPRDYWAERGYDWFAGL